VYALGCVLVACLTAREPFPRDSREATLWAHVHAPPPCPSTARPDLPPEIDDVIARALAKDPAERYPTAGALVEAVRRIVAVDPIRLVREPTPIRAPLPAPIPAPISAPAPIPTPIRVPAPAAVPAPAPMPVRPLAFARPPAATDRARNARPSRSPFAVALRIAAGVGLVGSLLFALGVIGRDGPADGSTRRTSADGSLVPEAMDRATDRRADPAVSLASPGPTSVAGRLLARIPIRDDCTQAIPDQPAVTAEFRCAYPRQRPDVHVAYDAYDGEATMNQAWAAALAADRFHAGAGRCPGTAGETSFYVSSDPLRQEAGRLLCYVATDRSAVIRWTLRDHGVIATAIRSDGDLPALYDLWASGRLNTTQDRR
jgi:serine/threonine-protein kinase